jgi:hypothetical protein
VKPVVPESSTLRRSTPSTKSTFQTPHFRDEAFLTSLDGFTYPDSHDAAQLAYLAVFFTCCYSGAMDVSDPRVYAAKQRGGNDDNPRFQQAMNGPAVKDYTAAMKFVIDTLVAQRT